MTSGASLFLFAAVGVVGACSSDPAAGVTAPAADSGSVEEGGPPPTDKDGGSSADSAPPGRQHTSVLGASWDSTMNHDITWSGAGVNNVTVALTKSSTTNPVFVTRTFAASALTGRVPAAALPKLKGSVFYSLAHDDDATVAAGGYAVGIMIRSYLREAASANGLATGSFTVN